MGVSSAISKPSLCQEASVASTQTAMPAGMAPQKVTSYTMESQTPGSSASTRSTHSQTSQPIKIATSIAVQTCNIPCNVNQQSHNRHSIFNCHDDIPAIPLVQAQLAKASLCMLVDTGSSLSLISSLFFNKHKNQMKYKFLGSRIKIQTVSGELYCQGSIECSLKINTAFFRHHFYIIQMPQSSPFNGILGYDFIKKFNLTLSPSDDLLWIDHHEVKLLSAKNNPDNFRASHVLSIDAPPFFPSGVCSLKEKVIVHPNTTSYLKLHANITNQSQFLLFQNSLQHSAIEVFDTIISNMHTCVRNELPSNSQNLGEPSHSLSFIVAITNNGDESFHLNKNAKVGFVSEIDDIRDDSYVGNHEISHQLNLIQPSHETLHLRHQEVMQTQFKLEHLPAHEAASIKEILIKHYGAFSSSVRTLGHTDRITPRISFSSDFPIKSLPFPVPFALQDSAFKQIQELLDAGIIERSLSDWSAPMLLVKKKQLTPQDNPQYRLALDLRLLNAVIQPSSYPLPKISTIIANIAKYRFFSTIDLASAYHQVDMPQNLQERLAFTTQWGLFQFRRLVFGLKSAASTFQALIDSIIQESQLEGCMAYQDDIVICSNSFEETCSKVDRFLAVLAKHNITAAPHKCLFHSSSIEYLGFLIKDHVVKPLTSNIVKITSFPVPTSKKQLKKFLGVINYYRSLIPAFAKLVNPLVQLTSPKSAFHWSDAHQQTFLQIQKIFFSAPFVILPDWSQRFHVNTDASVSAISGILMQKVKGKLMPISYFSKTLAESEKRYPALKLELMAIVKSIEAFKFFLYNKKFTVLSDSKPLQHYKKTSSPMDLTTRWLVALSEYDFDFQHIKGSENVLADYLSRNSFENQSQDLNSNPALLHSQEALPVVINSPSSVVQSPPCTNACHSVGNVASSYPSSERKHRLRKCNSFCNLHWATDQDSGSETFPGEETVSTTEYAVSQVPPGTPNQAHVQWCNFATLLSDTDNNDVPSDPSHHISLDTFRSHQAKDKTTVRIIDLIHRNQHKPEYQNFFINPDTNVLMVKRRFNQSENSPNVKIVVPKVLQHKALKIAHVNHFGIAKTYQMLLKQFYWKGMYADCLNFVLSCKECCKFKGRNVPPTQMQQTYTPSGPGQVVAIDFIGPFSNGLHILVMIDHFSRFLFAKTIKNPNSVNTLEILLQYICLFGKPHALLSDLGVQYTSRIFKDFADTVGIKLHFISNSHPAANGICERINKGIKDALSTMIDSRINFEKALLIHVHQYNTVVHPATQFSPSFVHFGRSIANIYDLFEMHSDLSADLPFQYHNFMEQLIKLYEKVQGNIKAMQSQRVTRQNLKAKERSFQVGDTVYMKAKDRFKKRFAGPYMVVEVHSPVLVSLRDLENSAGKVIKLNIDKLIVCPPRRQHLMQQTPPPAPPPASIPAREPRYFLRPRL